MGDGVVKVCVVQWGQSGAGPLFALELATAIEQSGHEILFSHSTRSESVAAVRARFESRDEIRTYRSRLGAILGLPRLVFHSMKLRRRLARENVDLVVIAMEHLWSSAISPILRSRRRPTILIVHDAEMHPGDYNRIEDRSRVFGRRFADGCVTLSPSVTSRIVELRQFGQAQTVTSIHPAFSAEVRPRPHNDPPIIGFFGRISEYKGVKRGKEAVDILRERGYRLVYRVVGNGDATQVSEMSHPDDQVVLGWIPDSAVHDSISEFDVLLLPYIEASQSGVLAQAMSLGVPTVATPVGGLREQALKSRVAVVAESTSSEDIADALEMVLNDPELQQTLHAGGIATARSEYSWNRLAGDVIAFGADSDKSRTGAQRKFTSNATQ